MGRTTSTKPSRRSRPTTTSRSSRSAGARPALRQLADRVGILGEYVDQTGAEVRETTDAAREALLRVMGIDASSERAARRALEELDDRSREEMLRPVVVVPTEAGSRLAHRTPILAAVPRGWPGAIEWSLEARAEDGRVHRGGGRGRVRDGALRLGPPEALGLGYHTVRVTLSRRGEERTAEQLLVITPPSCPSPMQRLAGRRVFGVITNLYTVRSDRNWGVGDFGDLRELVAWTDEVGGSFVGLNPLHALRNRGSEISPYSPVSRLFRNPLYLDVEGVPEMAEPSAAHELMTAAGFRDALERARDATHVDYEAVMALKRPVLEALHRVFAERHRGRATARGAAYAKYLEAQGRALEDFATFCAMEESGARGSGLGAGRTPVAAATLHDGPLSSPRSPAPGPDSFPHPRSAEAETFRESHRELVDFHRWVQFELDAQLGAAARRAADGGMPVGLYQDLAIGTAPTSADAWMFPGLFLQGVSIGAPPDPLSATGQNWGLPPLDPRALARDRYRYWTALVRSSLRHAGALRIDHVMGLFRQFWIPEGESGKNGAYVRFPAQDLLGILALESTRAQALVVGEDLGTVPDDVPPALERWQIMSSRVLYFERDGHGYRPPRSWKPLALATANTHDMPTLAGFWKGRDIELRREVGQLETQKAAREARATRERERADLVGVLTREGILPEGLDEVTADHVRAGVHAFLRRTPSWLAGLSLDDLVGEEEPVNLPGVGPEQFGSWTRRLSKSLACIRTDPDVRRALGVERAR